MIFYIQRERYIYIYIYIYPALLSRYVNYISSLAVGVDNGVDWAYMLVGATKNDDNIIIALG